MMPVNDANSVSLVGWFEGFLGTRGMGSSEMDKPSKEKEKDSKTVPTTTQV